MPALTPEEYTNLKESLSRSIQEMALKILTTPYIASGTVSDGEDVDTKSPSSYRSFSQWLDCSVEQVLRMRGDVVKHESGPPGYITSDQDDERFCPYDAVERLFPVLNSMKDNMPILQPFVDDLMDVFRRFGL
jgi:hypothetical protein